MFIQTIPARHALMMLFSTAWLLTGCSGGGAGDGNYIEATESAVLPLVGTWQLSGRFEDMDNDQVILVIQQPGEDGAARALFYDDRADASPSENCAVLLDDNGIVEEQVNGQIFLNNNRYLFDAVLSPNEANDSMNITWYDNLDVDGDGNEDEQFTSTATLQSGATMLELALCQ